MRLDRRSFLALLGASVASVVAACGATPTPAPPSSAVYGPTRPTAVAAQGARFSVDRTGIDFGNVKFNRLVTAVFTVTNAGNAPLVLKAPPTARVEAGC